MHLRHAFALILALLASTVAMGQPGAGPVVLAQVEPPVPAIESTPADAPILEAIEAEDADAASDADAAKRSDRAEPFIAPIPFRSPSLGWGGALAGGYIFPFDVEDVISPPSVVGGGVYGTENKSYGGIFAFTGFIKEDLWRVSSTVEVSRTEFDFYGIGSDAGSEGISVDMRTDRYGVNGYLLRKLPTADWGRLGRRLYIGVTYDVAITDNELRDVNFPPGVEAPNIDNTEIGFGLMLQRNTRDERFAPHEGTLTELSARLFDDAFGGDRDYQRYDASFSSYTSLNERFVAAWRTFGEFIQDSAPFVSLPSHDLRGYQSGRYRDKVHVAGEAELRADLFWRFGAVAYGGLGQVGSAIDELESDKLLWSAGFGLRFRLTEQNRMNYRADIAWGRDGYEWYFSITEAF